MKVVTNKQKAKARVYPWIGESTTNGVVVLFTADRIGTCISNPTFGIHNMVGEYATDWDISNFKEFTGTITLSND